MKTLKREEVYANQYADLDHLRANIEEFIELTIASGFTRHWVMFHRRGSNKAALIDATSAGATLSFFRHAEIYRSDGKREPTNADSPDHRFDESPTGYSSAGWSPPGPASASPAEDHSEGDETVLGAKINERQSVATKFVSMEGFTPPYCQNCSCSEPPRTAKRHNSLQVR